MARLRTLVGAVVGELLGSSMEVNRMKKRQWLIALLLTSSYVHADVLDKTDPVRGHAPVASDVQISNIDKPGATVAKKDEKLKGSYSFSDADGDAEQGSLLQWSYDDNTPISGANQVDYQVTASDVGKSIKLLVTPKTDAQITEPAQGQVAASALLFVDGEFIPSDVFLGADKIGWSTATSTCQAKGGRAMTVKELQDLYLQMTSATSIPSSSTEVCTVWNWPLNGLCGYSSGSNNWYDWYWSGDGYSIAVNMRTGASGTASAGGARAVACKRI
jgi:hypothetical protein